jgi:hypothetical protein
MKMKMKMRVKSAILVCAIFVAVVPSRVLAFNDNAEFEAP